MPAVAIFRIDSTGQAIAGNACAEEWTRRSGSNRCHRIVNATNLDGTPVCDTSCAQKLALGDSDGHLSLPTVVRCELARLNCHRVKDETVVVVELTGRGAPRERDLLTPRELDVIRLVARGLSSARIAAELGVSPSTVRTHVEHLCRRLGVRTRAQAVARATMSGQLLPEESAE